MKNIRNILLGIITMVAISLVVQLAFCVEAPDGFFGMKWGTHYSEFKSKSLVKETWEHRWEDGLMDVLSVTDEIEEIKFYMIKFVFYKERFMGMWFHPYSDSGDSERIAKGLIKKYGKPTETQKLQNVLGHHIGDEFTWIIGKVQINLKMNYLKRSGDLEYYYLPLFEEYKKNEGKGGKNFKNL